VKISHLLVILAVCGGIWASVTSVRIYDYLRKKNVPVSFFLLRVLIIKYVQQYRQVTLKETGRVGPLFYHFVISINVALVAAVAAIWSRSL
jgi:hypothetical protein